MSLSYHSITLLHVVIIKLIRRCRRIFWTGAVGESPVNSVPESQKELIDILNQIVSGQMTLAEGECLAEEWKMRHPKPNEQKQVRGQELTP